jgi:O-antigen biosynthesis protein
MPLDRRNAASGLLPEATIIIPTHNRPVRLECCLQHLKKLKYPNFTAVVADSAPSTRAAETLAAKYGAEYRSSPLKGVSRVRNLGANSASSEILAYLDDDMLPHEYWLSSLVERFADKRVTAVCGPVLPLELLNSNEAELQNFLESTPWGRSRGGRSFSMDKSSAQWFERANFGGIGDGNFALRRSAFLRIGGFDERLGRGSPINGGEEHYAYFRIIRLGGTVAYEPRAIAFHPVSPNSKEIARNRIIASAGYAFFLMCNHPLSGFRVLRFGIEGLFRKKRWWRTFPKLRNDPIPTK